MSKDQLKFLLMEARLDPEMVEHEHSCLARAGHLRKEQFHIHNLLESHPTPELLKGVDAVFFGGTGDYSVAKDRPDWFAPLVDFTRTVLDRGVPALGLCYGFHLMAEAVGGRVVRNPAQGETGTWEVYLTEDGRKDTVLGELPERFLAQQGHNDVVDAVPAPFVRLAGSERCEWQAFRHPELPFYGLQFHPELGRDDFMLRMRKYAHEYAQTPEKFQEIDDQVKETTIQAVIDRFIERIVIPHRERQPA